MIYLDEIKVFEKNYNVTNNYSHTLHSRKLKIPNTTENIRTLRFEFQRTDKTIKVCYLLIQISKNESVNKAIKSSPIKKINKTANHIREKALNNKKLKDSKDIQMKFSQNIEESSGFIENSIAQSQINEEQQSRLRILLKNESYKNEHEDDSNENMNNNDINK